MSIPVVSTQKSRDPQPDLLKIYLSIIRPVLEYACPAWSTSIPQYLSDKIEMVQKRALRSIYPGAHYQDILKFVNLSTLQERRILLCKKYFEKIKGKNHKLNHLLPEPKKSSYSLRLENTYPPIKTRTNRFKNSFLPWALSNNT